MNLTSTLLSIVGTQAAAAQTAENTVKLADRSIEAGTLTWGEAFQFLGVGLVIVFMTLAVLWLICELMGRVFQTIDAKKKAAEAKKATKAEAGKKLAAPPAAQLPPPAAPAVPTEASGASEEIPAAVFVAAAQAVMGGAPHRVVSVQRVADGVVLPVADDSTDVPLAVIAAAVAKALEGRPHRILNVRPVDMTWAREGRAAQHLAVASSRR